MHATIIVINAALEQIPMWPLFEFLVHTRLPPLQMHSMYFNDMTVMLAAITLHNTQIQCTPLRKAVAHMCVISLTVNHTLALENSLLNTLTCMVDLTCL